MCETHNVSSFGWYSFEKDSDNSKIADYDIAPPFTLKWTADASSPNHPGFGPFFLAKDGLLFAITHTIFSGNSIYRGIYNLSTGEKLFSTIDNAISYYGDNLQAKSEALINEYLIGTDTHYHELPFDINSGLQANSLYINPDVTNVDPVNNIYITQGWGGTDAPGYGFNIIDITNFTGAQSDHDGKFNSGFKFDKHGWKSFENIDLGKRSSPYNRTDTNKQLNIGKNNLTIMFWFKWDGIIRDPNSAQYSNEFLLDKSNDYYYPLYRIVLNNGTVKYAFGDVTIPGTPYGNDSFYCKSNNFR